MTTSTLKAARPIHATFVIIASGLTALIAAFHHATPPDERDQPRSHRRTKTPGGRPSPTPRPAAGSPAPAGAAPSAAPAGPQPPWIGPQVGDVFLDAPWPDDDAATLQWARDLHTDMTREPEPPLDPLPPDVVLHAPPDVPLAAEWDPPTAMLRADGHMGRDLASLFGAAPEPGHGIVTHQWPAQPGTPMPCCGRSPLDVPFDPIDWSADQVTCPGFPVAADPYAPLQHYATGLCWCGACHDQAPEPPVTGEPPVADRASLRDFVGAAMRQDTRSDARRFADEVLAGRRPAVLDQADEVLAPLFRSGPWRLDGAA